ncbi:MAG: hypothetical protein WCC60_22190 [Ilumatobacteraceae bacterium]
MASAVVKWQLKKTSARLRTLREELRVIDEQRMYLTDDADELELRAIVADSPGARSEAREAGGHAAAIAKARGHVVDEIARLERRQDELLDRLSAG